MVSKHVIILEDEESIANVLKLVCKRSNATYNHFYCVEDLLNNFGALENCDLFITDYNLGDSTSICVFERMQTHDVHPFTVLYTSNVQAIEDVRKAGLSDCINVFCDKASGSTALFVNLLKD